MFQAGLLTFRVVLTPRLPIIKQWRAAVLVSGYSGGPVPDFHGCSLLSRFVVAPETAYLFQNNEQPVKIFLIEFILGVLAESPGLVHHRRSITVVITHYQAVTAIDHIRQQFSCS